MRSKVCNCLALYDWEDRLSPETWIELALWPFKQCYVEPDKFILQVGDNERDLSSVDAVRRALENGPEPRGIQLFTTLPGYKQLVFGWRVSSAIAVMPVKTMFFGWDDDIVKFDKEHVCRFVRQVTAFCRLTYGIGYQRPFTKGPDLYAYGMSAGLNYSGTDRLESNRIGLWMSERMEQRRHASDMFRDVYPVNVVTDKHLSGKIEAVTLEKWITMSATRGTLNHLGGHVWAWCVPEESLLLVRTALLENGRLICG